MARWMESCYGRWYSNPEHEMRGVERNEQSMFSYVSFEDRVPKDHPRQKSVEELLHHRFEATNRQTGTIKNGNAKKNPAENSCGSSGALKSTEFQQPVRQRGSLRSPEVQWLNTLVN
jgi:hypothetical protein